jgi:hypothetical protein
MTIRTLKPILLVSFCIAFIGLPARASVEVEETTCYLSTWVVYGSSHGPCTNLWWTHEAEDGLYFDFQATQDTQPPEMYCTDSYWHLNCHANGMFFLGSISREEDAFHDFMVSHEVQMDVQLRVAEPTRIDAARNVSGILGYELHEVILIHPDGSEEVLLGGDGMRDRVSRVLDVGLYGIRISIDAMDYGYFPSPFAYEAVLAVDWMDTVGEEAANWGSIKSLYR